MKKIFCGFILLLTIQTVFSQASNSWDLYGTVFSNQWETSGEPKINSSMWAIGLNMSSYGFVESNDIGFFGNFSLLFPMESSIESGGIKISVDLWSTYDFVIEADYILGLGVKKKINETILFNFGIGPNIVGAFFTGKQASQLSFILGLGGDMGLKIGLNDSISINIGSMIAWDFLCWSNGSNTIIGSYSGFAENYSLFHLKPYIAISFDKYVDENGKTTY